MEKIESFVKDLNLPKCITCFGEIIYYNTKIVNGKLHGKSALTTKTTGHTLKVCEKCLSNKFPEYELKNKGRVFNLMNEITKYAFQIEDDIYKQKRDSFVKNTVETFKEKYGSDWEIHWNKYRKKQSHSNSFEYKSNKYGISKTDFDEFNKSRAVTKRNLTKKYGEVEGINRFNDYKQKQKKTKSFEYMVNKFGYEAAKSINQSKAHILENYIFKYGETEGTINYEKYWSKQKTYHSKLANKFFTELDKHFDGYTTYFAGKNKEYGVNLGNRYVFIDYYILELNVGVEYNGDLFHANPLLYSETDIIPIVNKSASEIWLLDNEKKSELLNKRGVQIITVWEYEHTKSREPFNFLNLKNKIINESKIC
jgi:hypothetical protein